MNRRTFLGGLGAAALQAQPAASRPNIIVILADDLGYGDLGCYGQARIQTPNLDRMASEGMRFTQAYAGSTVCAPSRCSMFTGYHTGHTRMRGNLDKYLQPDDVTLTQVMKSAGYRTGVIGKWSLGVLGTAGYPNDKGVDEWYGYFSQMHAHVAYPQLLLHNRGEVNLTGNWGTSRKQFANDLFTEQAVKFVESSTQPFFLHLAYTIPHADNEEGRDTGNGMVVPSDEPYSKQDWPQQERNFAAMITRMDRQIGRLMQTLKIRGIDNNTLVLFTSDNGPHREGGHDPDFFRSSGPLRGIKRDLYDGGVRVPGIARWPGTIGAGKTSDFVWAFWDVLPTCAGIAGAPVPAGLDGQSIVPTLMGRPQPPHEFLYWEFHETGFVQGVRYREWKAVRYGLNKPLELYDVSQDPGETQNVAAQNPQVVRTIEDYLLTARTESPDYPIREGKLR
jgi:arylsulfatase A-like enzyme